MSVSDLGRMRSGDYPDKSMSDVHDMMTRREQANSGFRSYMGELRDDIQERGILHPVQVDAQHTIDPGQAEYRNGHHRYHAAVSLGIQHLPVTTDKRESTGPNDSWQ